MNKDKKFIIHIILFYTLNIASTYFITTAVLNRYLVAFTRNIHLELNSIIGNFGILTVLLFMGFLVFKSYKQRSYYMVLVSFGLNIILFSLGIFSKYYQTTFSLYEMTLLKNPARTFGFSIAVESMVELFTYYRIVLFAPTIILLILHFVFGFNKKQEDEKKPIFSYFPLNNIIILSGFIVSLFALGISNVSMQRNWHLMTQRSQYGVQSAGLYNYYFSELMGIQYDKVEDMEIVKEDYEAYFTSKPSYTNMYGQTFSNVLTLDQASTVKLDPSIHTETLNGIFKDKNLVLVHLESFNHFLLEERGYLDETYYPFFKRLLKESYVLDNFYTNVGLGNSSDAEFTAVTGVLPTGDTTIFWRFDEHVEENNFKFQALPKLFNNQDYTSISLHGDVALFYNRGVIHEVMLGFNDFYYFDINEPYFEGTKNGNHLFESYLPTPDSPWLSDMALIEWTKSVYHNTPGKKFLFPINVQPHTPYLYNEFEKEPRFTKSDINVNTVSLRYLNYETFVEAYFKKFIEMTKEFKDTVYVFYSDHGSGIIQKDYQTILGYEGETLSNIDKGPHDNIVSSEEFNKESLRTLAFIYAPDDNDTSEIPKGLITGKQPKVRSQGDIYRTIIELFGLETDHHYFGTNLLSDESTFSIDTRTFSIVTDDYYIISKRFFNHKLAKDTVYIMNPNYELSPGEVFNYVYLYKQRLDRALLGNALQQFRIDK
ncbi:MAG: sulfatase-like hydrolase/transferase [Acholeplasmataceae bacterium]